MVGKLGRGRFYSPRQRGKVFSLLRKLGIVNGHDEDGFESDRQREAFFGRREKIRASDPRSEHAKRVDYAIRAKKVFTISEKNVKRWSRSRNHYDLLGVDTPAIARRARKTSIRLKRLVRKAARSEGKLERIKEEIKKEKIERRAKITAIRRAGRRYPEAHKLTGVERKNLYELADQHGVARDLIDWEAYTDSTLNYYENKAILLPMIKALARVRRQVDESERYSGELREYMIELKWRSQNAPNEGERRRALGELQAYRQAEAAVA